ncbi:hypothetical protein KY290_011555 [Solanum tuberosum]|uniref:Uncharacterized protein n=1 Tax=Solanum tuberosum TaxID=4113 RepID=A0ABQ7W317_SOLTU|nr:hypothetical protein KY290_011555 [Solanum tuberosum]
MRITTTLLCGENLTRILAGRPGIESSASRVCSHGVVAFSFMFIKKQNLSRNSFTTTICKPKQNAPAGIEPGSVLQQESTAEKFPYFTIVCDDIANTGLIYGAWTIQPVSWQGKPGWFVIKAFSITCNQVFAAITLSPSLCLIFLQDGYLLYNQIKQQEINVITGRIYGCDDNAIFEQYELGIEMIRAISWRGYQER